MKIGLFGLFLLYERRLLIDLDFLDIGNIFSLVVDVEILLLPICGQLLLL